MLYSEKGSPRILRARQFVYIGSEETIRLLTCAQTQPGFFDTTLSAVTPEMIEAVRAQYDQDWKEWPWQEGAPFIDSNGNGVMDGDEVPGFLEADQAAWFAYNDLDTAVARGFYGPLPFGLETQVTMWAYKDVSEFANVIFKRYKIIDKGSSWTPTGSVIDSMYLC